MSEITPNKPRRRWGWCCCSAVAVVVLALSLGAVFAMLYLVNIKTSEARVKAELTRLRQAGEPVTLSECVTKIAPGEKNAADLYKVVFGLAPGGLGCEEAEKRAKLPPEVETAWERDLVAHNQKYLSLIEEASRIPKCAFPKDWSLWPNVDSSESGHFSDVARALKAKAEVARRAGDTDGAVGACATILRLANHAQQSPGLIGHSVSRSLQTRAIKELARVFSSGDPSPAACRALYDQLGTRTKSGALLAALKSQRASGIMTFDAVLDPNRKGGLGSEELDQLHASASALKPYLMNDELNYLQAMQRNLAAVPKPYPEAFREMKAIEAGAYHNQPLRLQLSVLTALILPLCQYSLWDDYLSRSHAGAAQIATAAKAYKVTHGQYPASLKELERDGWRLPSDPFTSTPYHYAREKKGIAVWSVGPDLADNGGVDYGSEGHADRDKTGYDFVFRCSR